jgi:hypothetical protein
VIAFGVRQSERHDPHVLVMVLLCFVALNRDDRHRCPTEMRSGPKCSRKKRGVPRFFRAACEYAAAWTAIETAMVRILASQSVRWLTQNRLL